MKSKGKKLTTLDNLLPCELFICFKCNPFTAIVLDGVLYVTLTFESVDEILQCDHSIKSSLPVLLHEAICFSKFYKMKFGHLVEICLWLHLALKGLNSIIYGNSCKGEVTMVVN